MIKTQGSEIWLNRLGIYERVGCVTGISDLDFSFDMRDRKTLADKGKKTEPSHEVYDSITFDTILDIDAEALLRLRRDKKLVDFAIGIGGGTAPEVGQPLPDDRFFVFFTGYIQSFKINAIELDSIATATITIDVQDPLSLLAPASILWDNETPWDSLAGWR